MHMIVAPVFENETWRERHWSMDFSSLRLGRRLLPPVKAGIVRGGGSAQTLHYQELRGLSEACRTYRQLRWLARHEGPRRDRGGFMDLKYNQDVYTCLRPRGE